MGHPILFWERDPNCGGPIFSFAPSGLRFSRLGAPGACGAGCILSPLPGWECTAGDAPVWTLK